MNKTPAYNLKVVVNETGVKPDTLRAWERRYGLPAPERTDGGHRLYSQHDIDVIRWLLLRQDEGMSISRAVKLWRSMVNEDRDPLQEMAEEVTAPQSTAVDLQSGSALAELRESWIEACLNFDEARAERVLTQAFALYPPEVVCTNVLQNGLATIGEQWYNDKATVQQEHFASALAMRRLNTLLAAAPAPTRSGRVVVGCPPHEDHTFAPLMLSLLLRYRGWEVLYLGANVPLARFETTLQSIQPHLVILTAQTLYTASTLAAVAYSVQHQKVALAFAGSVFNRIKDLRYRIPGHFLGGEFDTAVNTVEKLLTSKPVTPRAILTSDLYQQAYQYYRQQQAAIEAKVWQILQDSDMPYEHFVNANIHLSRDIVASLTFGDMDFMEAEIAWVEKLLMNYNMPASLLRTYLQTYTDVVRDMLDERGEPIVEWLEMTVASMKKGQ